MSDCSQLIPLTSEGKDNSNSLSGSYVPKELSSQERGRKILCTHFILMHWIKE